MPEAEWSKFASAAKASIERELNTKKNELSLFAVVQTLTIEVIIKVLMPNTLGREDSIKPDALRELAHEISVQWVQPKVPHDPSKQQPWSFRRHEKLQSALRAAFPDWSGGKTNNPCNLLLPGYETMWRAVLRCFFELTVRNNALVEEWSAAVDEFLDNPALSQLKRSEQFPTPAIHIAKEVLRVYPPTRRVYRRFKTEDGAEYEAAADIEPCIMMSGSGAMMPLHFDQSDGCMLPRTSRRTTGYRSAQNRSIGRPKGSRECLCLLASQ